MVRARARRARDGGGGDEVHAGGSSRSWTRPRSASPPSRWSCAQLEPGDDRRTIMGDWGARQTTPSTDVIYRVAALPARRAAREEARDGRSPARQSGRPATTRSTACTRGTPSSTARSSRRFAAGSAAGRRARARRASTCSPRFHLLETILEQVGGQWPAKQALPLNSGHSRWPEKHLDGTRLYTARRASKSAGSASGEEERLYPRRPGGAGRRVRDRGAAAERDRRAAHGPRAQRLDPGRARPLAPDARLQRASGQAGVRPRRHRHAGGGGAGASQGRDVPARARTRGPSSRACGSGCTSTAA